MEIILKGKTGAVENRLWRGQHYATERSAILKRLRLTQDFGEDDGLTCGLWVGE